MTLTPRLVLLLTMPPLMWAGNAIVGRMMVGQVPPMALNAMRWWLTLAILLPLCWRVLQHWRDLATRWRYLALTGLLGIGSYNALQYLALHTSTPINVTLIAGSSPVWMLLFGTLFFGVKPHGRQWVGAGLSLVGVTWVLTRGRPWALMDWQPVPGDLFMLMAVALWALYSWFLAKPPAHMRTPQRPHWSSLDFLMAQLLFGVMWSSLSWFTEHQLTGSEVQWSPAVVAALAFIAIGPSALSYWAWGKGVATVGPATASFFGNLTSVFAAVASTVLLGEAPRLYHLVAFLLIASGIVISAWSASTGKHSVKR